MSSQGSKFVVLRIASRQSDVTMATQTRISVTKSVLDSMKNIKIIVVVERMKAKISGARSLEISKYIKLNQLFVAFNASGEPDILSYSPSTLFLDPICTDRPTLT